MEEFDSFDAIEWRKVELRTVNGDTTSDELKALVGLPVIQVSHTGGYEAGYLVWDSCGRVDITVAKVRARSKSPHPGAVEIRLSNGTALFGTQIDLEVIRND